MALLMTTPQKELSVTERDGLWKVEIERDIGALKTDIALIRADGANQMKELLGISQSLAELRKAVNVRTPLWQPIAMIIAGLSLVGSIGLVVIAPLNTDLTQLRLSHAQQGKELKDVYYKLGKVEAYQAKDN